MDNSVASVFNLMDSQLYKMIDKIQLQDRVGITS